MVCSRKYCTSLSHSLVVLIGVSAHFLQPMDDFKFDFLIHSTHSIYPMLFTLVLYYYVVIII